MSWCCPSVCAFVRADAFPTGCVVACWRCEHVRDDGWRVAVVCTLLCGDCDNCRVGTAGLVCR